MENFEFHSFDNKRVVEINNEKYMNEIEVLKIKLEAEKIKNEALEIKIKSLEMLNDILKSVSTDTLFAKKSEVLQNYTVEEVDSTENETKTNVGSEDDTTKRKRGRPKGSKSESAVKLEKVRQRIEKLLEQEMIGESFNKATLRSLTNVILVLREENGKATLQRIHDNNGGAKVSIVRHTSLLKRFGLIDFEGSRKKGQYALTNKGKEIITLAETI